MGGDNIGGKLFYSIISEVNFPILNTNFLNIKGAIFLDIANLFYNDNAKLVKNSSNVYNKNFARVSYGGGIIWNSPLGLLRFDYGFILRKQKFIDKINHLRFSVGSNF